MSLRNYQTRETSRKNISNFISLTGENNPRWKGDNVKKTGLHDWVYYHLGKPKKCEHCGKESFWIDWANKSHEYKRDLSDWLALCRSCHRYYDSDSYKGKKHSEKWKRKITEGVKRNWILRKERLEAARAHFERGEKNVCP